jgi:hypothetical protein
VLVWEPWLFDEMGMTSKSGLGYADGQSELWISSPGHALAAGLTGAVAASQPTTYSWGRPAASASVVATLPTGQPAIFAYEAGAALLSGAAPARRIGLFLFDQTAAAWTPAGAALFDAAVQWAAP